MNTDYIPVETVRDPETGETLGTIPAGGDREAVIQAARLHREQYRTQSALWDTTLACDRPETADEREARRILSQDWRTLQMGSDRMLGEMHQKAAIAAAPQPDMPGTHYRHSRYHSDGDGGDGQHF